MSSSDDTQHQAPAKGRKRWLRRTLLIGIPATVALAIFLFSVFSGRYISTENAYIRAPMISISPEVSGRISSVLVKENQAVNTGDLLLQIDPAPYKIAVARAEAQLRQAENAISTLKARYATRQEELELAKENVAFARKEYNRQQALAKRNLTSQSDLARYHHELATAERQQDAISRDLKRIEVTLGGGLDLPLAEHPDYQAAQASLNAAKLDLARTRITAPFAGIAAKTPDPGAYAKNGAAIMSLVGNRDLWIEANFKETELTRMVPGQKVEIEVDTYPDQTFEGTVQSIAQATGSEFSVLPAQNATGNWVKVVQRVPVRIRFDSTDNAPALRAGMSTSVSVDTGYPEGHHIALVYWLRCFVGEAHAGEVTPE